MFNKKLSTWHNFVYLKIKPLAKSVILCYNFGIIEIYMTENSTNEFSFVLKPSDHGVGVFAVHDIKKGTYLRMFGDEKELEHRTRTMAKKDVPEFFQSFCIMKENYLICPPDFGAMPVGWHLNHSKNPNAAHRNLHWYAARDIKSGEEILIDYNTLGEPKKAKEDYY